MTVPPRPRVRQMPGVPACPAFLNHAPATYYALTYAPSAPPGLPPAIQATRVYVQNTIEGPLICFYLDAPPDATRSDPLCILQIRQSDLLAYSEHETLRAALTGT